MRTILAACAVLLLAGCQSTPVEQMSYSETKVMFKQLHERCAAQGAPIGSAESDACIKQELSREASIRRDNHERQKNTVVCNRVYNTVICG